MKIKKNIINVVYLRFVPYNSCIKINLINNIYNEQYSQLSFFPHFISLNCYSSLNNLSWPKDGWIILDKISENDVVIDEYKVSITQLQDILKFIKKKISYDFRCLKNFEAGVYHNKAMTEFIENVAITDNLLFKRTQLRQLKRVYNQRLALCEFKSVNQPSKFKNTTDAWNYIKETFSHWFAKYRILNLDFLNGLVECDQTSPVTPQN